MFDIGWTELLVIGVVALIVVGPKDLPGMFRTLGRFTAKARSMAREFSRAMEDAADESGVGDIAKDLKNMTSPKNLGLDKIKDAASRFEDWDPIKSASKPKKGPATAALSEERAEAARKIHNAADEKATGKKTATSKSKGTKSVKKAKPAAKSAAKKPAAKTAAKTAPAKKSAGKTATKPRAKTAVKPAVASVPAKATTTRSPAKGPAKKTTAKKPTTKKPATKKPAAKKPAAKKPATGKPVAKKSTKGAAE